MKKILFHLILALCALTLHAEDVVVFKNGDLLTGKVLQQDDSLVYFKPRAFASVALQVSDIKEIKMGVPKPDNTDLYKSGASKAGYTVTVNEEEVDDLKEKQPWSGQAGMAIAVRESNTLVRSAEDLVEQDQEYESYRIYGNIDWTGKRNSLRWNWTYRYGRTDVRTNDDYQNLTQNYQHNFTTTYYTSAKTIYQQDFRRGIDSEFLQSAELGINWFSRPKFQLSTSAGGSYHQYDRLQDEYSGESGEFILDQSMRWQMINSLTLFQKYTHLGNLENYHFVFNSGLENKLVRDVFLRLEYRLDRDTDVNYDDSGYYDKALLTSLLYKF